MMSSLFLVTESVQQSLERIFGRGGGNIPITPSDAFEQRMGVSTSHSVKTEKIVTQSLLVYWEKSSIFYKALGIWMM